MSIKQISVFIENKSGQLSEVCSVLAKSGVDLKALSIADTQDFGILRIIVGNTEKAMEILRKEGYTCKTTNVLAVEIEDKPGGMSDVMSIINKNKISVEYAYAFISHKPHSAYMIFRVPGSAQAQATLKDAGITIVDKEELFD